MPKRVLTINDFSGGLVTDASPRDIEPNELETCTNGDPSSKGRITSCRVFADADSIYEEAAHANEYTAGYGMFAFSNDYKISGVTTVFTDEFICNLNGTNLDITEPVTATTASVVTTWDASSTRRGVGVYSFYNVKQTSPIGVTADDDVSAVFDLWVRQVLVNLLRCPLHHSMAGNPIGLVAGIEPRMSRFAPIVP